MSKYLSKLWRRFLAFSSSFKLFSKRFLIPFLLGIIIQLIPIPGYAQTDTFTCPIDDGIEKDIPEHWKEKFPFDLIYPIDESINPNIDEECPKITMFGQEREICTVKMLTSIAKNVFLLKIAIQSLLSL